MKRIFWLIAALCVSFTGLLGAAPIQVAGSRASFEPPPGFGPVPQAIIDIKWPSNRAPRFVLGNEAASTTVAYDLKPHTIAQENLAEVQTSFTGMMERVIPGIHWVRNELIEIAGQRWLFMEMTSNAIDTDIHNLMLITGLDDQMLIFNFNSTKKEFPTVEKAFRSSLRSITIAR